jgi:hypothetical protein
MLVVDPSFSVLLATKEDYGCKNSNKNKIEIVVPIVAVLVIALVVCTKREGEETNEEERGGGREAVNCFYLLGWNTIVTKSAFQVDDYVR